MAHFSTDPDPDVVEIIPEGARPGRTSRPGLTLHQVEVKGPLLVGAVIMKRGLRPHGVIAHGLIAGRPPGDVEYFFRSLYMATDPLAEMVVDVPDPQAEGLLSSSPPPVSDPVPARVEEIATETGWDHVLTERLSPGRSGMFFRKRILTDTELIPVVNDVLASLQRIQATEERLAETVFRSEAAEEPTSALLDAERKRADAAERALNRLSNRRSVRFAMAMSRPFRPLFRSVRSWKKKRLPGS